MVLFLYWRDRFKIEYKIAKLEKKDDIYYLEIYEEELKKATRNGCMGIGNITFLQKVYKSKELFSFFKNRIPSKNHPHIDRILNEYGLKEYDEMQLLKITRGALVTDRYYLK